MIKKWFGIWPANCEICAEPLKDQDYFAYGNTPFMRLALMCPDCHNSEGMGLGSGRGQKYDSKTLIKLEG